MAILRSPTPSSPPRLPAQNMIGSAPNIYPRNCYNPEEIPVVADSLQGLFYAMPFHHIDKKGCGADGSAAYRGYDGRSDAHPPQCAPAGAGRLGRCGEAGAASFLARCLDGGGLQSVVVGFRPLCSEGRLCIYFPSFHQGKFPPWFYLGQ